MNVRELWASVQRWYAGHGTRDRRILVGVAAAIVFSLVYVGVAQPIVRYRRGVADEVNEGHEQLERAARFLAAADGMRAERDDLKQRLEQAKHRLLPGSSGTLGAAALQEQANSLAAERGITVQSTQVMKEEGADPFRKVSIRLTLSGELKPFSELLSGLEYGPHQLTVPFLEVTRRGAVAGAKGPRTLSATVELSGYLLGEQAAKPGEAEAQEGEAEAAAPPAEGEAGGENPAVPKPSAETPPGGAEGGSPAPPGDQPSGGENAPGPAATPPGVVVTPPDASAPPSATATVPAAPAPAAPPAPPGSTPPAAGPAVPPPNPAAPPPPAAVAPPPAAATPPAPPAALLPVPVPSPPPAPPGKPNAPAGGAPGGPG